MKANIIISLIVGLAIGLSVKLSIIERNCNRILTNQMVDLPEEYDLITRDQNNPEQLQGWTDKEGIIHIEFKH